MSLATTRTHLVSVVSGVSGTANVRARFATDIDRADAEAALVAGGKVNVWEFAIAPRAVHGGASGLQRIACRVQGVALYQHAEGLATPSFQTFVDLVEAVLTALVNPTTGFPQLDEGGVAVTELTETPVATRTGHSAYRARIEFGLLDVDNT